MERLLSKKAATRYIIVGVVGFIASYLALMLTSLSAMDASCVATNTCSARDAHYHIFAIISQWFFYPAVILILLGTGLRLYWYLANHR